MDILSVFWIAVAALVSLILGGSAVCFGCLASLRMPVMERDLAVRTCPETRA